ncbi:hypothetical protein GW17_00024686 [Ensete ventricosum]|nr:hypothetical protein GW17_00024686 [Ensete ventricosum]
MLVKVSSPGLGHVCLKEKNLVLQVVRHLIAAGHDVHVVTGAPEFVFTTEIQSPNLHIRKVGLDTEEVLGKPFHQGSDGSSGHAAAADAGIRSVCVTNFSIVNVHVKNLLQIAEDYSHCEFLLRLPGYCPKDNDFCCQLLMLIPLTFLLYQVREELGIGDDVKVVIFNFGGQVAAHILQDTAIGKKHASDKLSGARRLRDAIVLGYQLQRAPGRDLGVPDWYSLAENEVGLRPALPNVVMNEKALLVES